MYQAVCVKLCTVVGLLATLAIGRPALADDDESKPRKESSVQAWQSLREEMTRRSDDRAERGQRDGGRPRFADGPRSVDRRSVGRGGPLMAHRGGPPRMHHAHRIPPGAHRAGWSRGSRYDHHVAHRGSYHGEFRHGDARHEPRGHGSHFGAHHGSHHDRGPQRGPELARRFDGQGPREFISRREAPDRGAISDVSSQLDRLERQMETLIREIRASRSDFPK